MKHKKEFCSVLIMLILVFVMRNRSLVREREYTRRSYDMITVWQSVLGFYGRWYEMGGNGSWHSQLPLFQERLWECRDDYDFYLLLSEMLAALQDGHARIFTEDDVEGKGYLPFEAEYIGGSYVVVRKLSDGPIPLFSEIVSINGEAADVWLEREKGRYVGVRSETGRKIALGKELFHSREGTYINILYREPGGQEHTRKVRYRILTNQNQTWERIPKRCQGACVYDGETMSVYQDGRVFCMQIRLFSQQTLEEFYEDVASLFSEESGVVVDLRECGGGALPVGKHLIEVITGRTLPDLEENYLLRNGFEMKMAKQIESIENENTEAYLESMKAYSSSAIAERGRAMIEGNYYYSTLRPDGYSSSLIDYIKKEVADTEENINKETSLFLPCVILTGGKTYCAAEELALLAQIVGIPLIGETTAGVNGSAVVETLSNGWKLQMTASDSYGPRGERIWNCGVHPDIPVCTTVEEYINGTDRVLQRGILYVEQEMMD